MTLDSLDDKLFSFWILQDSGYPFTHVKGIYRFETGVKVTEFKDLRANPRFVGHLSPNPYFFPDYSFSGVSWKASCYRSVFDSRTSMLPTCSCLVAV